MTEASHFSSPLSRLAMMKYGSGDLGLNFYWQSVGFFLLFFYTDIVGLPSTMAGVVYAIGGLIDAFTDPLMGIAADRTRSKWGRYRPYLLFGAVPLGVSFILLFSLPSIVPGTWLFVTCLLTHALFRLCYTAVSIPYGALGARLTFSARERTSVAGIRMMSGALGGMIIIFLASYLREEMPDATAFVWTSIFGAVLGAILIYLAFAGTVERRLASAVEELPVARNYPAKTVIIAISANRPFLVVVGSLFLLTLASMIVVKTILYRFEHILGSTSAGGVTMTLMTATPLVSIPLWVWVYHRLDKQAGFLLGCAFVIISLIGLYLVGGRSIAGAMAAYVGVAAGFSAFAVGIWSIIPDTIDFGHWRSGSRIESGLVGLASAIQKIAIALAGLGVGIALDIIGYRAGETQSPATITALHNFATWMPAVLMALAAALFKFYPISSAQHAEIVSEISSVNK